MRYNTVTPTKVALFPTPRGGYEVFVATENGGWRGLEYLYETPPEGMKPALILPAVRAWSGTHNSPGGDPRYNMPTRVEAEGFCVAGREDSNSETDFLVSEEPELLQGLTLNDRATWSPEVDPATGDRYMSLEGAAWEAAKALGYHSAVIRSVVDAAGNPAPVNHAATGARAWVPAGTYRALVAVIDERYNKSVVQVQVEV